MAISSQHSHTTTVQNNGVSRGRREQKKIEKKRRIEGGAEAWELKEKEKREGGEESRGERKEGRRGEEKEERRGEEKTRRENRRGERRGGVRKDEKSMEEYPACKTNGAAASNLHLICTCCVGGFFQLLSCLQNLTREEGSIPGYGVQLKLNMSHQITTNCGNEKSGKVLT